MCFVHSGIESSVERLAILLFLLISTYICNVIPCKQYLGNGLPKKTEKSIPHAHELALTYSCKSLPNCQLIQS